MYAFAADDDDDGDDDDVDEDDEDGKIWFSCTVQVVLNRRLCNSFIH